jgi:hypothetical protein
MFQATKNCFCVVAFGLLCASPLLGTFDPGSGPGNIDATKDVAIVSSKYTFTDGNYARGAIYFQRGFNISANSTVRLGITTPVSTYAGTGPAFKLTSTVILERPLLFEFSEPYLQGTFQGSKQSGGRAVLRAPNLITLLNNVFFPGTIIDGQPVAAQAEIDVGGGYLNASGTPGWVTPSGSPTPWGVTIYFGDMDKPGTLTIRDARLVWSDAPTLTWPVFKYDGHPRIQTLYPNGSSVLHWYDCTLNILEQMTLRDMDVNFHGNCSIKNSARFDPVPALYNRRPGALPTYPGGASKARFIVDGTNPGSNHTVFLTGPSSLTVGPDVDMRMGSLGLRQEVVGQLNQRIVYPFGSIMGQAEPLIMSYDCSINLIDSSITCSLPCTLEGGARLVVQGTCDLYATSTYSGNRIFTAGRYAQNSSGFFPMDSLLDIQINSKLNVHNTVLCNNNNP